MRRFKAIQSWMMVLTLLSFFPSTAFAGEGTTGDYFKDMGTQFGRGLWNVVSSPAEIPCTINADVKESGGVGAITGTGKGLAFFVRRAFVGICEAITFVIPMEATLPPVCSSQPAPGVS